MAATGMSRLSRQKVLLSTSGNDTLYGYATDDSIFGGAGDDYIYGGSVMIPWTAVLGMIVLMGVTVTIHYMVVPATTLCMVAQAMTYTLWTIPEMLLPRTLVKERIGLRVQLPIYS